jgi:hypothetical protein
LKPIDMNVSANESPAAIWEPARARTWYDSLPWLRGCNFIPSSAINQLEMWQAESFDPTTIERELGWLAGLGLNSMRVFLHDLVWAQDAGGFFSRVEQFLDLAEGHGLGIMFVFFDSCWHPFPELGKQRAPRPGVHNSYWLQSPGLAALKNEKEWGRLEDYVCAVTERFRDDPRVQIWDVWNEPQNNITADDLAGNVTMEEKRELVLSLLEKAFAWVRSVRPAQPLTSAIWRPEDWQADAPPEAMKTAQLGLSDIISFHCYEPLAEMKRRCEMLRPLGRPLLCTEYLARGQDNRFQNILPYFQKEKIAAYNWGAVAGKTQTNYPWDSCAKPYATEPVPWHHDILRIDGTPYDPAEAELLRSLR